MLKHQALQAYRQSGVVGDVALQLAAAASDQVVTDVRGSGIGAQVLGRLTRALDGAQRDPHLGLAGRVRQRLDRVPVAIAAGELHAAVDAGRVALQDLFDQADALDVLVPIERGAKPKAGDGVAHREVAHRLSLMLRPHGLLHRGAGGIQPLLQLLPEPGGACTVLAHALQQLVHERDVEHLGKQWQAAARPRALEGGEAAIRLEAARAALDQLLGQPVQVLDQGELEHAGPRPQLADREGCDGLIGVDEPVQPVTIESRVAIAEQLDGHGVDACRAGELARGQLRKLSVVARWKVMADLTHLAFHQVEVVEQPLGGGRDRLAPPHVAGEEEIRATEHARVVGQAPQQPRGTATWPGPPCFLRAMTPAL